jgi:hypothetical protein
MIGIGIGVPFSNHKRFEPRDIPGCQLWVDASQISGLVNNDPVGRWDDLTGLGHHLTQATASKKPTYITNYQNGLPFVIFDGVDDNLKSNAFTLNQPEYIVAVLQQNGWTFGKVLWDGFTKDTMDLHQSPTGSTNSLRLYAGTFANGDVIPLNTTKIVGALYNGGSSSFTTNNILKNTGDVGLGNAGGLTLAESAGTGFNGKCSFGEILIYNRNPTDAEKLKIHRYLANKWGVFLDA